jgi:hypothetical protein
MPGPPAQVVETRMPTSIDQDLTPNAIIEFNTAKEHGKSEGDAWAAAVARIRYDVLRMAIAELARGVPRSDAEAKVTRNECIHELLELQASFEQEPDQPA